MPLACEPVLFEALCTPPPSLGVHGLRIVVSAVGTFGLLLGAAFVWFGAWPVLGFFGVELLAVGGLLALHRRRSARPPEIVRLVGGTLHAGGAELVSYWTRIELRAGPGGGSRLLLRDRGRVVEIGAALGEAARLELASALQAALAAHRRPEFDNPQLRPVNPPGRGS